MADPADPSRDPADPSRDPDSPARGDPAEKRLWLLTGARLLGVAVAFLGLWLFATQRQLPGAVLMLAGVAMVAVLPRLLLRRWRG